MQERSRRQCSDSGRLPMQEATLVSREFARDAADEGTHQVWAKKGLVRETKESVVTGKQTKKI